MARRVDLSLRKSETAIPWGITCNQSRRGRLTQWKGPLQAEAVWKQAFIARTWRGDLSDRPSIDDRRLADGVEPPGNRPPERFSHSLG